MTWEAYFSPCYLNVIDPIDTAFGEGIMLNVTHELYEVRSSHTGLAFCFSIRSPVSDHLMI